MMNAVPREVRSYMAEIGRRGGSKSRRTLTPEQSRNMLRIREARRAFAAFHPQCFWYLDPNMKITEDDIPEIIHGLRANGGRKGFLLASKLCH